MNVLELNILQIQTDLRQVEFAYRKRSFPQYEDEGLLDLFIGGNGLSVHTKTAFDPNLWYTTVIPLEIKADIDVLKVKVHDTMRGDMIYRLMGAVFVNRLKRDLCRAIEDAVFDYSLKLYGFFTNVANRVGKEVLMGGRKGVSLW